MGLGLNGEVTEREFDTLEAFFRDRGCRVEIEVCPLADESMLRLLGERGYRVFEWTNVLVQPIGREASFAKPAHDLQIRRAREQDTGDIIRILSRCFLEQDETTAQAEDLFGTVLSVPGASWFVATLDGVTAGCAGIFIYDGSALLAGAATLPTYRGRGIQNTLSRERLRFAAASGCDLVIVMTKPGSISQRNAERQGFQVVYTRSKMASEWK
jgi:ribosomal protein S18 acetylase RimI-like enzyme